MAVRNVHERIIRNMTLTEAGALIDNLGSRDDKLWPRDRWPPIRFDRPLGVGAHGGHADVRYTIEAYEPGRRIQFRFTAPRGFVGTHEFDAEEIEPGRVRLRHTLVMSVEGAARLSWPFVFRPLHDALVEDAFDRAESLSASAPVKRRKWSLYVRLLRFAIIFRASRNDHRNRQTAKGKTGQITRS